MARRKRLRLGELLRKKLEGNERQVHVCLVHLKADRILAALYGLALSDDERARANRFRFERLKMEYTIARGALRYILGFYLSVPPKDIRFHYGPNGKPKLAIPADDIRFNVSHSASVAAYAIARGPEVGIDIEQIRAVPDMLAIAKRFFSVDETSDLESLGPECVERGFFYCWTRKEAYIKARGDGLSLPLSSFRVTLRPFDPPRIVEMGERHWPIHAWTLHNLPLRSEFAAALAYQDTARPVLISDELRADEVVDAFG